MTGKTAKIAAALAMRDDFREQWAVSGDEWDAAVDQLKDYTRRQGGDTGSLDLIKVSP